jgi:hypothetical protein
MSTQSIPKRWVGQKIIAKIGPPSKRQQRNCRISAITGAGTYTVNVFSRKTNTWYTDEIDVTEAEIAKTISGADW